MIFLIVVITVPIIAIIAGLILARRGGADAIGEYMFNAFAGLFIGGIAGLLFAGMIASIGGNVTAKENGYSDVETYELVALATQQETEGSGGMLIFVGWAQVGETRTAYWTAKDSDGIAQMYSAKAEEILVKETDTKPRYVKQAMVDDSGFWWPGDHMILSREYLEVPAGTLTANYEFQP